MPGLSWMLWFLEVHRDKPDPLYENQPIIIYCIHTSVLIKPGWLRWPQSSGSNVPRRIRSVLSHMTYVPSRLSEHIDIMRAIETIQTITWKPGLTKYKSISMVFISTFQIYFYETRSSSQSLRMQFFRSDPLDVFNLVDEDRSLTFLFYITDLR